MKEEKKKSSLLCLLIIVCLFMLCACGKKEVIIPKDETNSDKQNNFVPEEDVEEISDDYIYIKKTFIVDEKHAKVEYKYENSMYEIKINDKKVKNDEITTGRGYQIEQINDAIVIAIKTDSDIGEFSIYAFDFTGKQILYIEDYVDAENYMSLRVYGDSAVHKNWALQITDSTIKVVTGRVNAGKIDGISNPCSESEIANAKITDDTMMAAQYSISYLGNGEFSDPKIERINIDYTQYKSVFPCR